MIGESNVGARIGSLKWPSCVALLMMDWSKSAAKTKSRGEGGSPCLTPLLQWNVLPGTPFNRTTDVPELRMESIQDLHYMPKPLCAIISKITLCSTLSKAFSKSSFRTIISFFEWWHRWRYSKDHVKRSRFSSKGKSTDTIYNVVDHESNPSHYQLLADIIVIHNRITSYKALQHWLTHLLYRLI
jgi:hypothetical protein